jgi:hypothetical protein
VRTPQPECAREIGEGRDDPLRWGAPSRRTDSKPDFVEDIAACRSRSTREHRHRQRASWNARPPNPVEKIFAGRNQAGAGKPPSNGAAAVKALFKAVKEMLSPKEENAPQPVRRRRGETDKGFAAACRTMLRRADRPEAATLGGNAAFADLCARVGVFLSDTLDCLNPWQDNAANDHWQEDEFSATYWDNFPQP